MFHAQTTSKHVLPFLVQGRGAEETVCVGRASHTFEADSAQEARARAMRPKVHARNLAYVVLFWLSAVASLVLARDEPQLTVIISFHVTMCILSLLVRSAARRTFPRRGRVCRARTVGSSDTPSIADSRPFLQHLVSSLSIPSLQHACSVTHPVPCAPQSFRDRSRLRTCHSSSTEKKIQT